MSPPRICCLHRQGRLIDHFLPPSVVRAVTATELRPETREPTSTQVSSAGHATSCASRVLEIDGPKSARRFHVAPPSVLRTATEEMAVPPTASQVPSAGHEMPLAITPSTMRCCTQVKPPSVVRSACPLAGPPKNGALRAISQVVGEGQLMAAGDCLVGMCCDAPGRPPVVRPDDHSHRVEARRRAEGFAGQHSGTVNAGKVVSD